jgi:GNAT superfamily N-acetyltransferase
MPEGVTVSPEMTSEWRGLYAGAQAPERLGEHFDILSLLRPPCGFIVAHAAGKPAGVAVVGRVGDDVAVDCVLTHPAVRRSGAATAVMYAAEAWASAERATRLLLTVAQSNDPARALYAKLGYEPLTSYHFRIKAP